MTRSIFFWLFAAIAFLALLAVSGAFYVVPETEQVVLTQFGKPVGSPVRDAGLHMKVPFIQKVNRLEKRVLGWDGPSTELPTKDKLYIIVDSFGRWRISDPLQFLLRLRDYRTAQSRLDDLIGGEVRNAIARHELVELIRTTKGRQPVIDEAIAAAGGSALAYLPPIQVGRVALEQEVSNEARARLAEFGIELLDVRFKRINYNPAVAAKIFERMISERRQIAERFRSEGAGEAAKILGTRERDIKQIDSEAYRKAQAIQGKADAEATAIYAQAFNGSPEAREFYYFTRALESYRTAFQRGTTVVMTTEDGFLRFLKGDTATPAPPSPAPAPNPASAGAPAPAQ
jgi:membrane protease subunit HflC